MYAFWVLGLLAVAGAMTERARSAPGALWWCPVLILLSTAFFQGSTRYRSPADPFIVMLAALGLVGIREVWGRRRGWRTRPHIRLPSAAE
jgi:hypothetical protein